MKRTFIVCPACGFYYSKARNEPAGEVCPCGMEMVEGDKKEFEKVRVRVRKGKTR